MTEPLSLERAEPCPACGALPCDQTSDPGSSLEELNGNEIWEALQSILRGNIPDEMTEGVCDQLAAWLNSIAAGARDHSPPLASPHGKGWEPIETAPKDGTLAERHVLLIGRYPAGHGWSDIYQCWWDKFLDDCQGAWARWPHHFAPTHFMPLPPPPGPAQPEAEDTETWLARMAQPKTPPPFTFEDDAPTPPPTVSPSTGEENRDKLREGIARAICDAEWGGTQPPFDRKPTSFGERYRSYADAVLAVLPSDAAVRELVRNAFEEGCIATHKAIQAEPELALMPVESAEFGEAADDYASSSVIQESWITAEPAPLPSAAVGELMEAAKPFAVFADNYTAIDEDYDDEAHDFLVEPKFVFSMFRRLSRALAAVGGEQSPPVKRTMTLTLTDEEMAALDELAKKKDLEPPSIFRQALRLYQLQDRGLVDVRRLDDLAAVGSPNPGGGE